MPTKDTTNKSTLKWLSRTERGFDRLSKISGVVIQDSQHVVATKKNFVGPPELSETDEKARNKARFRAAKLGQAFDESETPPAELDRAEDALVDSYLEDIVDDALGI